MRVEVKQLVMSAGLDAPVASVVSVELDTHHLHRYSPPCERAPSASSYAAEVRRGARRERQNPGSSSPKGAPAARSSSRFSDEQKTGQLMNRITNDTFALGELCHHGPEDIVLSSLKFVGTFVIAHRLSTVRNAQRIVVLTNSGIDEQGTHEELIAVDGAYASVYNMQLKL